MKSSPKTPRNQTHSVLTEAQQGLFTEVLEEGEKPVAQVKPIKKGNPDFTPTTAYVANDRHDLVQVKLVPFRRQKRDYSDVVNALLQKWLDGKVNLTDRDFERLYR